MTYKEDREMQHKGRSIRIGWQCLMVMTILIMSTSCGSSDGDVDEDRGATSIKITIQGGQHCGYVTHNLDRSVQCWTGSCTWDFTPGLQVTLEAWLTTRCMEFPGFKMLARDLDFRKPP